MTRTILPHQLPHALDARPDIAMLSLDCFDTLLWRDVNAPADLFRLLDGITPGQRRRGEAAARKARILARHASAEVTLDEIYTALLPDADRAERSAMVAHECAVEARHCYAFAPTVALMHEAKRRGLPIVVVSDTYFTHDQLDALIRTAAGDEVADLIDRIFCSCDYRSAKGERLFETVLRETGVPAANILHIGDNERADQKGGERHGLVALHLVQFTATSIQRLRQEGAAGAMLAGSGAAFQPHRAALAAGEPVIGDAGELVGFGALGPVLAPFARWIVDEAHALDATSEGRVHMVFLMRDGHLPREMVSVSAPDIVTHAVEISRFAATAASLYDPRAIHQFLQDEIGDNPGVELLRQLMIVGQEAKALLASLPAKDRALTLVDTLMSKRWRTKIMERGRAYADRLIAYLRETVAPAPGDIIMLVDLGYNGTVQNRIDTLLAETFGVRVAGRYLLLTEDTPSGLDKQGFIDRGNFEPDALQMLTSCAAVLEQFCTVAQGSVVDYRDGAPIRSAAGIKGRQSEIRERVQAGCIAFGRRGCSDTIRREEPGVDVERRAAAAALARLMFLPLPEELALMSRFEHDSNLGSDEKVELFDPAAGARGLRDRGLFYLKDSSRMYLPAELRGQGLPTSLALLAQKRFALDLRYADFCDRQITLPVLVVDGTDAFVDTVQATPTHDGWFVAAVPIGACRYTVGVQFGRLYDYVQIEDVRAIPVTTFLDGGRKADALARPVVPSTEGMDQVAPHLFRCAGPDAFLMVPPPAGGPAAGVPMMLTIVFRPIAERAVVASDVASLNHAHGVAA